MESLGMEQRRKYVSRCISSEINFNQYQSEKKETVEDGTYKFISSLSSIGLFGTILIKAPLLKIIAYPFAAALSVPTTGVVWKFCEGVGMGLGVVASNIVHVGHRCTYRFVGGFSTWKFNKLVFCFSYIAKQESGYDISLNPMNFDCSSPLSKLRDRYRTFDGGKLSQHMKYCIPVRSNKTIEMIVGSVQKDRIDFYKKSDMEQAKPSTRIGKWSAEDFKKLSKYSAKREYSIGLTCYTYLIHLVDAQCKDVSMEKAIKKECGAFLKKLIQEGKLYYKDAIVETRTIAKRLVESNPLKKKRIQQIENATINHLTNIAGILLAMHGNQILPIKDEKIGYHLLNVIQIKGRFPWSIHLYARDDRWLGRTVTFS